MAGISAIPQSAEDATAYLRSSHFTISQDPHVTKPCQKSTFMIDYPPWEVQKTNSAPQGIPAEVLMRDHKHFSNRWSETQKQFEYRALPSRDVPIDPDKLRATNFKMDRDLRQNTWQTSHKRDFVPKDGFLAKEGPKLHPQTSCIPQGDREKADAPMSDYKDRYRGHDASVHRPDLCPGSTEPTLRGDNRQHHYVTTHNDLYRGHLLPKIQPFPKPTGTNVPQGDPYKEATFMSVQQQSYPKHDVIGREYDREAASKLRQTTFKDQEPRLNNYVTTFSESYTPKKITAEKPINGRRDHDDIPRGDGDLYRMTTNRFYQGNKPPTVRPVIVSGANKRTHSNVLFAEPRGDAQYYETTHNEAFKEVTVPYGYQRNNLSNESRIPLDYYKNSKHNTLYRDEYFEPGQEKMVVNQEGLDRLKESHIGYPLGDVAIFSTEHKDKYVPKALSAKASFEAGRLQKSSLPIGTLNQ